MAQVLKSLLEFEKKRFKVNNWSAKLCKFLSAVLSYCNYISKAIDISTVVRGSAEFQLYMHCLPTVTGIRHLLLSIFDIFGVVSLEMYDGQRTVNTYTKIIRTK